jgi:hypothetical protein
MSSQPIDDELEDNYNNMLRGCLDYYAILKNYRKVQAVNRRLVVENDELIAKLKASGNVSDMLERAREVAVKNGRL